MSAGLFANSTGRFGPPSRKRLNAWNVRVQRERQARLDRFAEFLADGLSLKDAAARLGVGKEAARRLFVEIKAGLGPQAV